MVGFLGLCQAFINGCAQFFSLPFPGLGGISIFTVFVAFLVADVIISSISIVFGFSADGKAGFEVHTRHIGSTKNKDK